MDRSLWLLLYLRGKAWGRRFIRSLSSLKGILLGVVGLLILVPMALPAFLVPRIQTQHQVGLIREYGAFGLFCYCLLNILLSSGERAVTYSPAEINFLFPGPYRPRQILLYRMAGGVIAALLTAFAMTFAFAHHTSSFFSAFVGLFLGLELLYLFSMTIGLIASTLGALAFGLWRRILLGALILLIAGSLYPLGQKAFQSQPAELLNQVVTNPVFKAILLPFKPPVMAFAADHFTDLLVWTGLGLFVNVLFVTLNLALNARFLEASAKTSAKVHARLLKARSGNVSASIGKARFEVPMFPRWRGAGPIFWRQMVTVSRTPSRLVGLLFIFLIPVGSVWASSHSAAQNEMRMAFVVVISIAFFAPTMIGYDFRSDLDRMEELKALPLSPTSIVVGQLISPLLILCVVEWSALGFMVALSGSVLENLPSFAMVVIPLNIILVAIENLYFLLFPFRNNAINALDVQSMGRQLLLTMAKLASVAVIAGLAIGLGWLAYTMTGDQWNVGLAVTWITMMALALSLLPLLSMAFRQFDVTEGLGDS